MAAAAGDALSSGQADASSGDGSGGGDGGGARRRRGGGLGDGAGAGAGGLAKSRCDGALRARGAKSEMLQITAPQTLRLVLSRLLVDWMTKEYPPWRARHD